MIDPYRPGDIAQLEVRPGDGLGTPNLDQPGLAWTMKKDGEPVACCGFVESGPGVALVWMIVSDGARGHGVALLRFCRRAIRIACEEMGWYRLQAAVRADREEYHRWAKMMGFEQEGRLRKAAPDRTDVCLYARLT